MKIALILLVLVAVACVVRCDLDSEWKSYKDQFNKIYDSKVDSFRKELFRLSTVQIEEHNRLYEAGKSTFLMGLNHLSDWTIDEIRKTFMSRPEHDEISYQWEEYKKNFNKHYDSNEESFRKSIFHKNMEIINEHNKKFQAGESTYEMGLNNFTDMTFEEFKKIM